MVVEDWVAVFFSSFLLFCELLSVGLLFFFWLLGCLVACLPGCLLSFSAMRLVVNVLR
ncbi:hypothetical protein BZA05DRAFT_411009 [Tricharina praecox]|uniref:uncharacterized protein n=1 Tax=Tricharina praecox TaxID=43433 RepID=UPI00221FB2CF|nr:uncharacterized protein BZA05DRAFT_411009 [Tricharina praecox]KAI5843248.1 hypothetical protein BZA05DRAFT_411009 [Tricharina praecox]